MNFEFSDEPQILRIYNYAPDTQEFKGESDGYIAPNTGLPANCTLMEPPASEPGTALVWRDDVWQKEEDHRGMVVYNTQTRTEMVVTTLGPLPENITVIKPDSQFDRWNGQAWLPDINDVKTAQIIAVKARRDEVTEDYIIISGNHFHSDTSSRIQQLSLTRMGQAEQIPAGLMWQTKNNGLIELTNETAAQFEAVTMEHDMRLYANAQRHIAALELLDDVQSVLDYDYSTGWQP